MIIPAEIIFSFDFVEQRVRTIKLLALKSTVYYGKTLKQYLGEFVLLGTYSIRHLKNNHH